MQHPSHEFKGNNQGALINDQTTSGKGIVLWSRIGVLTGDRYLTKTTSRHLLKHTLSLFKTLSHVPPTSAYI